MVYLKRVVAFPGETVEFKDGVLFVNGQPLQEPYVNGPCNWNLPPREVEPGQVYLVGDNRSMPMEQHDFGQTSERRIVGGTAMVTRNRVLAALGLLLVAWGLWYFFPTRERQVRRQFKALASWASKDGEEGSIASLQTAREARDYFADPCQWTAEAYQLAGNVSINEITQYVFAARTRMDRLSVKFYDLRVEFTPEGQARVTATVRIVGVGKAGDTVNDTRELKCTLVKVDGRWLLKTVILVQVLKR